MKQLDLDVTFLFSQPAISTRLGILDQNTMHIHWSFAACGLKLENESFITFKTNVQAK